MKRMNSLYWDTRNALRKAEMKRLHDEAVYDSDNITTLFNCKKYLSPGNIGSFNLKTSLSNLDLLLKNATQIYVGKVNDRQDDFAMIFQRYGQDLELCKLGVFHVKKLIEEWINDDNTAETFEEKHAVYKNCFNKEPTSW